MRKLDITAVVLTKNEEKNIEKCLKSLSFCREILVIDDFSIDNTVKIAKSLHAKVIKSALNLNFARQRNLAMKKASYEWILFVDADEIVTPKLKAEISKHIKDDVDGFLIYREDILWGKRMRFGEFSKKGKFGNALILRFGRKGKWKRKIHEYWDVKGKVKKLDGTLLHFPHPSLSEFLSDIEVRGLVHSNEIKREGKKVTLSKVLFWPLGKFFYNTIFKFGILDGVEGFIVAILMSFHSFLSWSNLYINEKNKN